MGVGAGMGVAVGVGTGVAVGVGVGTGVAVGVGCGVGVSAGAGVGGVVVRDTPEAHADRTNSNAAVAKRTLVNFILSDPVRIRIIVLKRATEKEQPIRLQA